MLLSALFAVAIAIAVAALCMRRWSGRTQQRDEAWETLASKTPWHDTPFDTQALVRLPEAAQRYFRFAILPGTPLRPVAVVATRSRSGRTVWDSHTLLAVPHGMQERGRWAGGLLSRLRTLEGDRASGGVQLLFVLPLGDGSPPDASALLVRSLLRAALWTPAALLRDEVRWTGVSDNAARAELSAGSLTASVEITVGEGGRLVSAAAGGTVATTADFMDIAGYRVPRTLVVGDERIEVAGLRYAQAWAGSPHS